MAHAIPVAPLVRQAATDVETTEKEPAMKCQSPHQRGGRMLREAGYKRAEGGRLDEEQDAKQIASGVHQHEAHMHKGEKKTKLKLKSGGGVHGKGEKHRPDRRARGGRLWYDQPDDGMGNDVKSSARARGGAIGKHKGKVTININAAQKGDPAREQMAHQAGVQKGLMIGRNMPHPGGPPAAPPPGAGMAPPMAPPMGPPHPPMAAPVAGPMGAPSPMGARPPGMP